MCSKLTQVTEGAIAEAVHVHGFDFSPHTKDVAQVTVRFVLTGEYTPGDRLDPMDEAEYADESLKQIVGTIADYLLDKTEDLFQVVRLSQLWTLAGRLDAA